MASVTLEGWDKPTSYVLIRSFRRMTRAIAVPVGPTASSVAVPEGHIKPEYDSFLVINPNLCWVGLRGTSWHNQSGDTKPTEANMTDEDGLDWLFAPGQTAVWSTQYPIFMSAIALEMPGFPLPQNESDYTPLRVYYGNGS